MRRLGLGGGEILDCHLAPLQPRKRVMKRRMGPGLEEPHESGLKKDRKLIE